MLSTVPPPHRRCGHARLRGASDCICHVLAEHALRGRPVTDARRDGCAVASICARVWCRIARGIYQMVAAWCGASWTSGVRRWRSASCATHSMPPQPSTPPSSCISLAGQRRSLQRRRAVLRADTTRRSRRGLAACRTHADSTDRRCLYWPTWPLRGRSSAISCLRAPCWQPWPRVWCDDASRCRSDRRRRMHTPRSSSRRCGACPTCCCRQTVRMLLV